jgi:hypothetical protein
MWVPFVKHFVAADVAPLRYATRLNSGVNSKPSDTASTKFESQNISVQGFLILNKIK